MATAHRNHVIGNPKLAACDTSEARDAHVLQPGGEGLLGVGVGPGLGFSGVAEAFKGCPGFSGFVACLGFFFRVFRGVFLLVRWDLERLLVVRTCAGGPFTPSVPEFGWGGGGGGARIETKGIFVDQKGNEQQN